MMKQLLNSVWIATGIILCCFHNNLYAQNFAWAKQIGDIQQDESFGIANDAKGNVYTVGRFGGTLDFNPGTGPADTFFLRAVGGFDGFISKLDANGNFVWVKQIAGAGAKFAHDIALDTLGNIYVTGSFNNRTDFNPATGAADTFFLTAVGSNRDVFVLKLDSAGNFIWAKSFGGTGRDEGHSIAVDASGNVFTVGQFAGTVNFNPGTGSFPLTAVTSADMFVSKLDANGNFIWAGQVGINNNANQFNALALDAHGNIYTASRFTGTVDFDPGVTSTNLTAAVGSNGFITKWNNSGGFIWAKHFTAPPGAATGSSICQSIAVDSFFNVYATGSIADSIDMDPGSGSYVLYGKPGPSNSGSPYLVKLDSNGNFVWAEQYKHIDAAYGSGISLTLDGDGNIYSTGHFGGSLIFGNQTIASKGGSTTRDVYITVHEPNGNLVSTSVVGGDNHDLVNDISLAANAIHVNGTFTSMPADFNPGEGIFNLSQRGLGDIFILKLSKPCFDSYEQLELTSCDTLLLNGDTFTTSGIYTQTLLNSTGCDSIITINLTITSSTYDTLFLSECSSYTIDDETFDTSGTYTVVMPNAVGCDSIVTLHLTITTIDNSVTQSATTLISNTPEAAYQWIDCNSNHQPIAGATNSFFNPTVNGSYAVVIILNGCTDTSDCYNVTSLDIKETNRNNRIHIYPNPTDTEITLKASKALDNATIRLVNIVGQVVREQEGLKGNFFTLDMSACAVGTYFVEIREGTNIVREKIVKK